MITLPIMNNDFIAAKKALENPACTCIATLQISPHSLAGRSHGFILGQKYLHVGVAQKGRVMPAASLKPQSKLMVFDEHHELRRPILSNFI